MSRWTLSLNEVDALQSALSAQSSANRFPLASRHGPSRWASMSSFLSTARVLCHPEQTGAGARYVTRPALEECYPLVEYVIKIHRDPSPSSHCLCMARGALHPAARR
jgi:hypothetical protein